MPKRFTDTEIWKEQRWFRKLSPAHKLAFLYIKDRCNHAGIWKIDCADLIEDTGLSEFNLNSFIAALNIEFDGVSGKKVSKERGKVIRQKYLWLTGFMQFQYEKADRTIPINNVTTSAIKILKHNKVFNEGLEKGWITLPKGLGKGEGIG